MRCRPYRPASLVWYAVLTASVALRPLVSLLPVIEERVLVTR
ncbi:MAG TPA: hypothetical protein VFU72_09535 [Nitrolancea sp.]|nr:hypothetical protein [Nitrolancea sp.]